MAIQQLYTLTFSDLTKTATIEVPGTLLGSGRNNYDTSLDLVGPGYTNFGQSIAQNFVKLLENFAGPIPPAHGIQGQLWYDTSNPDRHVLRINNGEISSARWPSANGIYQQSTDPVDDYLQNVKEGDVWVDTQNNQLKIRFSDNWTLVGPSTSVTETKTGFEAKTIEAVTGLLYPVILNWVNGKVVEIISYDEFTPREVIDGFSLLKPGVNLTNKVTSKFNGLAERALSLELSRGVVIQANELLRNKIPSTIKQIHSGTLVVESVDGFSVRRNSSSPEVRIYSTATSANIEFTATSGYMNIGFLNNSYISFNTNGRVGINTLASGLTTSDPTLTVDGGASFSNAISITTSTSSNVVLTVGGAATVAGDVSIGRNANIAGHTTISNTLTVIDIIASTSTAILGTETVPFERIFVTHIGTSTGAPVSIQGTVTTATQLSSNRTFKIAGIITSTEVSFNGSANVVLTATTNADLITSADVATSTSATQTLLVVNTSTPSASIEQISKADFLSDVYESMIQPGMIVPYGGNPTGSPPTGWAWCNASASYSSTDADYQDLYSVIGRRYTPSSTLSGLFYPPDLSTSTYVSTGTGVGVYLQYIIKL